MNAKRLSATVAALLAASAIAAAGCGGDDDNGTDLETSDLSKSEWIAKADQICAESDKAIDQQAQQTFKSEPSQQQLVGFTQGVVVPGIEAQVNQIRDLGAPEGDEDEIQTMLDTVDEGLAKVKADPTALERGALDSGTALAQQYGLKVCGADDEG